MTHLYLIFCCLIMEIQTDGAVFKASDTVRMKAADSSELYSSACDSDNIFLGTVIEELNFCVLNGWNLKSSGLQESFKYK